MSTSLPTAGSDILFIVNSVFGGRNTPGFRPYQLVRFGRLAPNVIARGSAVPYQPIGFPLPGRSLIPRGLNFIRIKFWSALPTRAMERWLFDHRCLAASRRLGWRPRAVHLWDALPETAVFWHAQGVPLVLDLQMAHPRCYQPLVATGAVDPALLGSLEDPATDRCIALADRLVCPSHFVQDSLPTVARRKSVVIPFGADPIAPTSASARNPNRPLRVLFAGNVNLRKGIPFLIEAWRRLPAVLTDHAELILCGRIFREMVEPLAAAPPSIRPVGFQAEMAPWFNDADLFVLPSLMEGSAKAVYEAMAHGLPVVVSSHSGSVVESGVDGWVVPPADVSALADALAQLLGDAALRQRLGAAARTSAARYTWDAYAAAVADLYQDQKEKPTISPVLSLRQYRRADTYREHQAPRALLGKINQSAQRAIIRVKAHSRCIGGTRSVWLRFPFYHHVFADERRGFVRHLEAMRQYGEFISLDQALGLLASGRPYDGRYFCLTFDDGFRNILTHAAPILAEREITAAIFVVSNLVSDNIGDWGTQQDNFFGPNRLPAEFLSWDDCRALSASGFTIGSHSANHRHFIELSATEVEHELSASKAQIEQALGQPCHHFCCPWGKPGRDFKPERDPALAAQLGYRSFLTTRWGSVEASDSPFSIRRVGLVARYGLSQLRYFLSL
ncbi:hypothetical protein CCP3SC15_30001 [Gammaproteobacteria bacterium]